jgi:hypothetical protein
MKTTTIHSAIHAFTIQLKDANKQFLTSPSADNWNRVTTLMLAYQQAKYLRRSPAMRNQLEAVEAALGEEPMGDWPDIIVRAATCPRSAAIHA